MAAIHDDYLAYCREHRDLSDNSLRAYNQDLTYYARWEETLDRVPHCTEKALVAFHQHLKDNSDLSPATARRRFVVFKAHREWRDIGEGRAPISCSHLNFELTRRSTPQRPKSVKTDVLIEVLSASCRQTLSTKQRDNLNLITGLAIRLIVATGFGPGELTRLLIGDVMDTNGTIRVASNGKRKERTVYVSNADLLADLNAFVEMRRTQGDPSDPLLINSRGDRLTEQSFRKRLCVLCKAMGIEQRITPYQLRHSGAKMLIDSGVDTKLVQRLLGHACITTTEQYSEGNDATSEADELKSAMRDVDPLAELTAS